MSNDEISEISETVDVKVEFVPASNPLSQSVMPQCLSMLGKTGNGLGYSYIRFQAKNRDLTDINLLQDFRNLRYVDISYNNISDINPLSSITYLLSIKADSNLLNNGIKKEMKYLQFIDVSKNKFTAMEGIYHPELEIVNLKFNKLKVANILQPHRLTRLHTLELRGNKLETVEGLNLPNLKHLYLAENQIKELVGLECLVRLTLLHLRGNNISTLDGFSKLMINLHYLNLRDNKVADFNEIIKLQCLPALKHLILSGNRVEEEIDDLTSLAVDVLMYIPTLSRVNKTTVTSADKREAKKKCKCLKSKIDSPEVEQENEDVEE